MKQAFKLLLSILVSSNAFGNSFVTSQKKYERVRTAYAEKETTINSLLTASGISTVNFQVYIRAFKDENIIELWAKNNSDSVFKLIKNYEICSKSGKLGPKRERGDLQVPEGFYYIDGFNPMSNFYLSMGLNYPNKSDQILGVKNNLGGDIFIHGSCVTIGCLPITDFEIKELYVFCTKAKDAGQLKIPVTIFPAKLTAEKFADLAAEYFGNSDNVNLWTDLEVAFRLFNKNKQLPKISFLQNGRHIITE